MKKITAAYVQLKTEFADAMFIIALAQLLPSFVRQILTQALDKTVS